jgi:hypothetical protein
MRHFLFILILSFSHVCFAHQDTALNITADGNITGLPEQFAPASFDRNNLKLTIGKTTVSFPACVAKFFADETSMINFSASWYHDDKQLPAYLNIEVLQPSKDFHFQLLFTLDNLKPIAFYVLTKLKSRTFIHELVVDDTCKVALNG